MKEEKSLSLLTPAAASTMAAVTDRRYTGGKNGAERQLRPRARGEQYLDGPAGSHGLPAAGLLDRFHPQILLQTRINEGGNLCRKRQEKSKIWHRL